VAASDCAEVATMAAVVPVLTVASKRSEPVPTRAAYCNDVRTTREQIEILVEGRGSNKDSI